LPATFKESWYFTMCAAIGSFSEQVSMGVSLGSRPPRELEANNMAWLKQTALELLATQSLKWTRSALEAD